MFETVVDHLIDNADRYRYDGGEIRISLALHEDAVVVEIFNNGPGISEELMPHLFKVGTTDKATNRNRGLGLYASRAYLFGMRATISAENRFHGVAMVIVFPQLKDADRAQLAAF
jgi:K+-sensing histidine kinase KdpD